MILLFTEVIIIMKEKAHIIAMRGGKPLGFIKSVSVAKNRYTLTPNKYQAKGYVTADACKHDIDKLAAIAFGTDTIFIYD